MTEWNGIKVGSIYKRKGKGSRGAPLALVVEMKGVECFGCYEVDCGRGVNLQTLEGGVLRRYYIQNHVGHARAGRMGVLVEWPYTEVA